MWISTLFMALVATLLGTSWTWPVNFPYADHMAAVDQSWTSKRGVPDYLVKIDHSPKPKRLMGIFRCNGWGPGCTHFNDPVQSTGGKPRLDKSSGIRTSSRSRFGLWNRHNKAVFEPFFTLTSGGSWGPTGKKRSSPLPTNDQVYRRNIPSIDEQMYRWKYSPSVEYFTDG